MKLSILDLSITPPNGDRHQAIKNTLELAQLADRAGYHRFWMAEHHGAGTAVGRSPEVMIPYVASQTDRIHVGSGAVLLNHYSPFKVAEVFNSLEEMFPGRVDMGIGRATGGPVIDFALQQDRTQLTNKTADSEGQLVELLHWMNQDFPSDEIFSKVQSWNNGTSPEFWLLGSSPWSARMAAQLGLNYSFAAFINPGQSYDIAQSYRNHFVPTEANPHPHLMLALNVFVADTVEEAHRMTAPFQWFEYRLKNYGDTQSILLQEDEAIKALGSNFQKPLPLADPLTPPRALAGTPDIVASWLEKIADAYGADEIMLQTVTSNHEARLRSTELLAEEVLAEVVE